MLKLSCEEIISKMERENSGHQIFKNLKEEFSIERVSLLKKIAALADYYEIAELKDDIRKYIEITNEDAFFNFFEAVVFESKLEEYKNTFNRLLKLFYKIEDKGISESPISYLYGIEEWVVKWAEYNSYSFLPKLRKWFRIDYDKLIELQNNTEISYDTAVMILENVEFWNHEPQLLNMVKNFKFKISEEKKNYSALELYFDILVETGCVDILPSIEVYISNSVSLTKLKKKVKCYWEKYEYKKDKDSYFSSSGEQISCTEAIMLGVTPKAKKFFKNSMLEILHSYNLQIKLPRYISCT